MKNTFLVLTLSFFLLATVHFTWAQSSGINGTIKSAGTNLPVDNAVVPIDGTNLHVHSDTSGHFTFMNSTDLAAVTVVADRPVTAASSKHLCAIDFDTRPKNSAQDLLRLVPGLFIAQHAGGGKAEQIFVRGFDCDHGTDVATFVDDMPVNMPSHGHGQGYQDLHFLIPETVKEMNVFKGPYFAQFGNFATAAAVQFNTHDSLERNLVQLETGFVPEAGDFTTKRGLLMLQIPRTGSSVSSYLAGDVLNNRGYFEKSQDLNRFSLFSKTTIAVSERSRIRFSAGGFRSSWNASGQIPERAVRSGLISRFGSIDGSEGGSTQRSNFNLSYLAKIQSAEFETRIYASGYRFKLFSNFTFNLEDPVHGDEIEQGDNRSVKGMRTQYAWMHPLGTLQNKLTVGASFRDDEIENQLWHTEDRRRLEPFAHAVISERTAGFYASEVFRFSDYFRAELGARVDYFHFDVEDLLPDDSSHANNSGYNFQSLFSPKANIIFTPNDRLQFFVNAGSGFHSNDARVVVQQQQHELPRAVGAEVGALFHLGRRCVVSAALWWLDLENELVFAGDDGTTEDKGPSRRSGLDVSARAQINRWLHADADVNFSRNRFTENMYGDRLRTDHYVPLAPTLTSAGGLTASFKNSLETGLRYRFMADRPANESNTVIAHGYEVFDFTAHYKAKHFKIGLTMENIFNTEWNEAQFDTESRLPFEEKPVDEIHFTPGTPFAAKLSFGYLF